MPFCKFCDEEIEWEESDTARSGWIPINPEDGSAHRCQSASRSPAYQSRIEMLEQRIRDLETKLRIANTNPAFDADMKVMFLMPGAPSQLVQAAYRALALLWHPDHGGSNDRMRALNIARDNLTRRGMME